MRGDTAMTTETLIIEGRTITIDYNSIPEERPSMDSPGCDAMLCINSAVLEDGSDAIEWLVEGSELQYPPTAEQCLEMIEELLEKKLLNRAEESAISRHEMSINDRAERMRAGRRA